MKLLSGQVATIVGKSGAYALTTLLVVVGSAAGAATLLSPAPAFNGRVVRLEHASRPEERQWLVATALVPAGGKHANVYLADRDGAPFRQIGEITDPEFGSGVCCGTLYELPRQVGSLQAGTLLWAASVGKKAERMAIRIYRSEDEGRSWSYLSEIRAANPGGIWEPEFTLGSDGALILFFSDETNPAKHSQTIKKVRVRVRLDGSGVHHLLRLGAMALRYPIWCGIAAALRRPLPPSVQLQLPAPTSPWLDMSSRSASRDGEKND